MVPLSYVFTIFFVTLGPLKTIPAFGGLTRNMSAHAVRSLAGRSTLIAAMIVLATALVIRTLLEKWKVSIDALLIAGGIVLFVSSIRTILQFAQPETAAGKVPESGDPEAAPPGTQAAGAAPVARLAATPLAVPVIVTPTGIVAILAFMDIAVGNTHLTLSILGLLLLVIALNWLGMVFARPFLRIVGATTLQIVGWVFAVLQAGLAVEMIVIALSHLGVIPARVRT